MEDCQATKMKIAIFSDTHDNLENIKRALEIVKEDEIDILIHCGDICAPYTLLFLGENFKGEIHYCFGNVDGDRFLMLQETKDNPKIHHHGQVLGELEINKRKIAFQHYPQIARVLAKTQKYDAVFYGHDHKKHQEKIKKTLLVNPGNLCNIKYPPSFAIYHLKSNKIEFINL
jgi:hypothetical protein